MRILVLGAYGMIGAAVLSRLHRDGHNLVGAGRSIATATRRLPFAQWIAADFHHLLTQEAWRPMLAGIDAVVNCVGALQAGSRDQLERIHEQAPAALFAACEDAGVRRVVHISAIGADANSPTEFGRGKAATEAALRASKLDWVILRPGLVLAPAVYGGSAMLFGLAAMPLWTPLLAVERPIQIVAAEDVAETVAWAVQPQSSARLVLDLVHPQGLSLREVVTALRRWLGFAPRPAWIVPCMVTMSIARIADALGWLGWRSPARSNAVAQLAQGVTGDPDAWIRETGIRPRSLDDMLALRPATVQDRWFARLYPLKPLAIGGLALFWIATGVLALGPGYDTGLAHLTAAGFTAPFAKITVIAGALFDIVLGLLLLVRRFAKPVLITMLVATVGYVIAGTLIEPSLWADPLGPLTKILPMLLATLFTLAIIDER
jgi:uncharacterized protein YbjT (DUF2867 family)